MTTTLLALGLLACFIWAVVASVSAQEWMERARVAEHALEDERA